MDGMYREELLEHWRHSPYRGTLAAPDLSAKGMNPLCGDEVQIALQVVDGRIACMRFIGNGCVMSQAAASLLGGLVEGHTVAEVQALDRAQLLRTLDIPLSPARLQCALLPLAVLRQALGTPAPDDSPVNPQR
ncbi:MAG: iron-sulfur cluster assembly scaffold protein [Chloroflexi bacterium]|nr:iron-sulfur cluster assembly scaffold protein [Chloroflexota bacterium]